MPTIRSFSIVWRLLILSFTLACAFLIGIHRPSDDWDIIGYVASAYHLDGYRGQDLSDKTFRDVKSAVSDDTFKLLTAGDHLPERDYRQAVFSDPKALSEQLPFYSIRAVYVRLVQLVGKLGPSYSKSTYIVSSLFSALAVIVLGRILDVSNVPFGLLPLIVISSGIPELSRISSPDSLALFFALFCILAVLNNRRPTLFVFAAVLPLMRTDFIIVSALILSYEFLMGNRVSSAISMSLAILAYIVINKMSGNYGWIKLFNIAEVYKDPYPAEMSPSTNIMDYAGSYLKETYQFVANGQFVLYVIGAYTIFDIIKKIDLPLIPRIKKLIADDYVSGKRIAALCVIPMLFAVGHILLFPHYEARYFVFSATLVFVWILAREKAQALAAGKIPSSASAGVAAIEPAGAGVSQRSIRPQLRTGSPG